MNSAIQKRTIRLALSAVLTGSALILPTGRPALAAAGGGFGFTNFELAATPPQPKGTVCPNTAGTCTNLAAEPAIRADGAGNFYGSSENGLGGGTDAWKSTDGGLHYLTLVSPNSASAASNQFSPAGGDTDLAVASQPNLNGLYNVYVASLALTNVYVSTSSDGGSTWLLNPTGASVPGD